MRERSWDSDHWRSEHNEPMADHRWSCERDVSKQRIYEAEPWTAWRRACSIEATGNAACSQSQAKIDYNFSIEHVDLLIIALV